MIRTFAGTGGVVTTAGIVLGLTMLALVSADVSSVSQIGTTVGVGLVIDTLIVRTLVVPAIAQLTERRFWWPRRQPITCKGGRHEDIGRNP
jgi:RND superfamily putative drug exporter